MSHRTGWARALAGVVTGLAGVVGFGVLNPPAASAADPGAADISVVETPPATSPIAGTTADWWFTISNAGPADAVNVRGSDELPQDGLTLVSWSGAACSQVGRVVSCDVGSVPNTKSVQIRVTLALDPAIPAGVVLTNKATITWDTAASVKGSTTPGEVPAPAVVTQADLSWTTTANPPADGVLDPGDSFDYTIAVTNHGPSNARNVAVSDHLPAPLSFVSSTSGCGAAGQDVTCPPVPSMAPGTTQSFTLTVKLDAAYSGDGSDLGNAGSVVSTTPPPATDPTPPPASTPPPALATVAAGLKFVPVDPVRVLDTRDGTGGVSAGKVAAGGTVSFPVVGGAVPADAKAVALNVTTTAVDGPGYATVWPHGQAMPATSSVNVSDAGETAANAAVVPVGQSGMLDMSTFEGAHLVVDLTGYWVPAGSTIDGRLHSVSAPTRLLDTRDGTGAKPGGAFAAGEQFDLQVTGAAVPADATAAVLTVTYTGPTAPGYLTLWPTGGARPTVSTTNPNGAGDIRSNLAIVKLGTGGEVSVFSYQPSDVIIDVVGYFSADSSGHGLFTPMSPHRVEDSRQPGQPFGRIGAGGTATLGFDRLVPAAATTVIYNLTATQTAAGGFLTTYATGQSRPLASSVNWSGADQNRAAFNGSALGAGRGVDNYAFSATDVIVDLAGWFT